MSSVTKHRQTVTFVRDGETEYRFSRPVSHQRAFHLAMKAKSEGVPSGSVIEV